MTYDPTYQEGTSVAFPEFVLKNMAPPEGAEHDTGPEQLAAAGEQPDSRIAM